MLFHAYKVRKRNLIIGLRNQFINSKKEDHTYLQSTVNRFVDNDSRLLNLCSESMCFADGPSDAVFSAHPSQLLCGFVRSPSSMPPEF